MPSENRTRSRRFFRKAWESYAVGSLVVELAALLKGSRAFKVLKEASESV
jgi:hypothetical protein